MANPILVTGTAGRVGRIGRTVTELLLKQGKTVRAMVRNEDERAHALRDMGAEVVAGDLLDLDSMHRVITGCERVYLGMSVFGHVSRGNMPRLADGDLPNLTRTARLPKWLRSKPASFAMHRSKAATWSSPTMHGRTDAGERKMEENTLVQSSFSATINAPIEKVDIPTWCFSLSESEYQSCSPAHCSAGATTSPDGRRMSINVEILGGSPMVQHYIEEIAEPHHLRLVSNSDLFTPTGRIKVGVIWDLSVKKIDDKTCEFTNAVHSSFTPELLDSLAKQGIPWEVFQAAASRFRRRTTGRRRLSSPKVLSAMP